MDLDLDLFDRDDHERRHRRRGRHAEDDRLDHDDDRDRRRSVDARRPWRDDDDDDDDDRPGRRAADARRTRRDDDDDLRWRDDDDHERDHGWRAAMRRGRRHAPRWSRAAHPHLFAWLVLGGGAALLALVVVGALTSLGLWGPIADGYFALSKAVLPTSWHDEWQALPGVAHVAMAIAALVVVAGVAGEVLD